jgi:hypothetical protein
VSWPICHPDDPRRLIEPLQAQLDFAYSDAFATGYFGGWGANKSVSGILFCAASAAMSPEGSRGVVIIPNFPMMNIWLQEVFQPMLHRVIVRHEVKNRTFVLPGGRRIIYMSGHDPLSVQATNASWVYMDEAHLMKRAIWSHAVARARKIDSRLRVGLTSLPKMGWLSDTFSGRNDTQYRAMHARTQDNPYVSPKYVDNLKASCPKRMWPAYLEGRFCATGGNVYAEFDREQHVIDWPETERQFKGRPEVGLALDPSARRPHVLWVQRVPAGFSMPGGWRTETEVSVVVDEIYPSGDYQSWPIERLCMAVKARTRETGWAFSEAVTDPAGLARGVNATGCGVNVSTISQLEQFLECGIGYRTGERVKIGVQHVQLALSPSVGHPRLFISRHLARTRTGGVLDSMALCPADQSQRSLIGALESYSYPDDSRGKLIDEPFHDDMASHACDAIRYWMRYFYPIERLGAVQYSAL